MTDELEEMAVDTVLKWTGDKSVTVRPHGKRKNTTILVELVADALRTIRSKTRKEDVEKIKELRERIKRVEENAVGMLTAPCIECENLKRELNSPIRLSEKLCKPYEDEIQRLEKEKHEFFDAAVELGKQKEDLINKIEFLESSSLLAQEVSMKEDWRNRAVRHAEEILLLKERLSFFVGLIKEALKMGYCSAGWDKKAQAILKKDEEEVLDKVKGEKL